MMDPLSVVLTFLLTEELCADAALYVPPLDSNAWADTLLLASDEVLRQALIERGKDRISLFHWRNHVDRLCPL